MKKIRLVKIYYVNDVFEKGLGDMQIFCSIKMRVTITNALNDM